MDATFSGTTDASNPTGDIEIEKLHPKLGAAGAGTGFLVEEVRAMSVARRRQLVEREHAHLSITAKCR